MSTPWTYVPAKRLVDLVGSAAGLSLFSPVLLVIAAAVALSSPGPFIFKQERLGRDGRPFVMYKFRTMRLSRDGSGSQVTAAGDSRVTVLGRFLRRYKLDEFPQLLNVLKGDMSLVGPRPEVERYARWYPAEYTRILSVRPGITDFASLAFRNEEQVLARSSEPERTYVAEILPAKIKLYLQYLEQRSLKTDFVILMRTVGSVLR